MSSTLLDTPNLLGRAPAGYWRQSRRPISSLFFVLPLILLYECGILWIGPEAIRNGADVWMQQLLGMLGVGGFLLLPLCVIAILIAWHHTTGQSWRVSASVLYTMTAECFVLAIALVIFARLHAHVLAIDDGPATLDAGRRFVTEWIFGDLLRYIGAGIYEELLFRLMLLPVVVWTVRLVVASKRFQLAAGILLTSLVFAAAHYVGPYGEAFTAFTFVFRLAAGAFFAVLFVYRGFGIAAGTHALYDVLVGFPSG